MTSKVSTMSPWFSASGAACSVRRYPNPTRTGVKIGGEILPLKDGFSKVQATFAVTASVGGGWYDGGREAELGPRCGEGGNRRQWASALACIIETLHRDEGPHDVDGFRGVCLYSE